MTRLDINAARCEALFSSGLQESDALTAASVTLEGGSLRVLLASPRVRRIIVLTHLGHARGPTALPDAAASWVPAQVCPEDCARCAFRATRPMLAGGQRLRFGRRRRS